MTDFTLGIVFIIEASTFPQEKGKADLCILKFDIVTCVAIYFDFPYYAILIAVTRAARLSSEREVELALDGRKL